MSSYATRETRIPGKVIALRFDEILCSIMLHSDANNEGYSQLEERTEHTNIRLLDSIYLNIIHNVGC